MKIETSLVNTWKIATKTRPIKAKPLISLLIDRKVTNKFLVDCLEGKEPLKDGSVICIGEAGDVWQQTSKKLLQKYRVSSIDEDGWMVCDPLPDNEVNCIEVTFEFLNSKDKSVFYSKDYNELNKFYIHGQYGESVPILGENIQFGSGGDFVCQNRTDLTDVWIVKRKLFLNTYIIK